MNFSRETIFDESKGGNVYRAFKLEPEEELLKAVADEYVALRTSTPTPLSDIYFDGLTVVNAQGLKQRLQAATVPTRRGGPFDVLRSDFGETLAYIVLEAHFETAIGYKSVRDRELVQLPGRGIDVIGVEKNPELTLVLGETKVSDQDRSPPAVVDDSDDSLSKQLIGHITEKDFTLAKLWDTARKAIDESLRDDLFQIALLWEKDRLDLFHVIACAILIRPAQSFQLDDFGNLYADPDSVLPGKVRFLVLCVPDRIDPLIDRWSRKHLI